jgi:DNA polymerase III alpha subunit
LLAQLQPKSVIELAMVLAMIRPGKKHLIPVCQEKGFDAIENEIWTKTEDSYFFKKAHAVSYASVIIVQLNLLCERMIT